MKESEILLLLKLPPPYGGGEIMHQYLNDYFSNKDHIRILEYYSSERDKSTQGVFRFNKILEFKNVLKKVLEQLLKKDISLIYFSIGKSFPAFLRDSIIIAISKLFRCKVVIELHGIDFTFLDKSLLHNLLGKAILKRVDKIRVLGNSIEQRLFSRGIYNTTVIENGVQVPDSDRHNSNQDQLLFVGTLSKQKGFDILIKSLTELKKSESVSFELNCLGEWKSESFRDEILDQIKKNGLEENIFFHGLLHGEKKWEIFQKSGVLILPSLSEGQPLVILEAMGMRCIIIATNIGAIGDTMSNKNGYLIEKDNFFVLMTALKNILTLDETKIKSIQNFNREEFEEKFSLNSYLRNTEMFLMSMVRN